MKVTEIEKPSLNKPILISAMQDMGNVGSIAIDFINKSRHTTPFRYVSPPFPNYVADYGGYIEYERLRWEFRHGDGLIVFGGGVGQPDTNKDLYELCQLVTDVAKEYSAQLVYTLGAFHTSRDFDKNPETLVTSTSQDLSQRLERMGLRLTPGSSLITGFNGLMLGFAKENGLQGIGLFAEIDDPQVPQYRSAKSLLATLERLTYQKFSGMDELDQLASAVDEELGKAKRSGDRT